MRAHAIAMSAPKSSAGANPADVPALALAAFALSLLLRSAEAAYWWRAAVRGAPSAMDPAKCSALAKIRLEFTAGACTTSMVHQWYIIS